MYVRYLKVFTRCQLHFKTETRIITGFDFLFKLQVRLFSYSWEILSVLETILDLDFL